MPTATEELERFVIRATRSDYPPLGATYGQEEYPIQYSPKLIKTGKNYYDSKPQEGRMSTAGEELAIQLALERDGKDPRKANVFDDLFARGPDKRYMWQWTETGLRVPKGRNAENYETISGRKYWPRIVLIGDKEVGEILVPEGNRRVVVEWDEVFGIPRVTDNIAYPHNPYTTHFWLNSTPQKDSISGQYDVAVGRRSGWRRAGCERCLAVLANYVRWPATSYGGSRRVRGSVPEIGKELARINPKDVENDLLERMRADIKEMPLNEFLAKYNLEV